MCGLVGMAGDITTPGEKAFKMLLILDVLRGEHSTGMVSVPKWGDPTVKMAKQVGNPFELFDTRAYTDAMKGSHRVLIGHNRFATQGAINKRNAHPFEFETLVGAHNGTLTNKWKLPNANDFQVDSENLYHAFEVQGVDKTIRESLGAWALTWWDKTEDTLNFLRNKERTLYYTVSEDDKMLFWASEAWMLYAALGKNAIKHGDVEMFPEDHLVSVHIDKGGKMDKPVIRECKSVPTVVSYHAQQHSGVKGGASGERFQGNNQTQQQGTQAAKTGTETSQASNAANVKEVDGRSKLSPQFLKASGELFEAICIEQDSYGQHFVVAFCPAFPFFQCRVYPSTFHDLERHLGCEFIADISGFTQEDSNGGGWYRVDSTTVELCSAGGTKGDPPTNNYPNHHGKYIGELEWRKQYGECSFCNSDVFPSEVVNMQAALTTQGEVLCTHCFKDEQLTSFVRIAAL